jgi:hypothetical protein
MGYVSLAFRLPCQGWKISPRNSRCSAKAIRADSFHDEDPKDGHMIKMNTTYLPATLLLDAIGFEKRVKNRIEEYLTSNHIVSLSILQLMDLFLPQYQEPIREYSYRYDFEIPIRDQPQFGTYLFDSALLSITEAPMCKEARVEWALRLYPLMLLELKNRPTNIRRAELEARQAKRNNPLPL